MDNRIVLYASRTCPHSWLVERFMRKHAIPVDIVHIDGNPQAREAVMALNHGYASVPTLLFPDGTQLTEPSLRTLRRRLGIASPTLLTRLGAMFRRALCD